YVGPCTNTATDTLFEAVSDALSAVGQRFALNTQPIRERAAPLDAGAPVVAVVLEDQLALVIRQLAQAALETAETVLQLGRRRVGSGKWRQAWGVERCCAAALLQRLQTDESRHFVAIASDVLDRRPRIELPRDAIERLVSVIFGVRRAAPFEEADQRFSEL